MYTLLVQSDDTLNATVREKIYHRTSMMQKLCFLVDPFWDKDGETTDMRTFICTMEYRTPLSEQYVPVILTPSTDLYKGKIEYIVPINTDMTAEVGNVEIKLIWTKLEMNEDGTFKERVRKTPHTSIEIYPVAKWSDFIADSKLDNIAQILLSAQSQNEQMKEYAEQIKSLGQMFMVTKADNVTYDKEAKQIQLESMGAPIGRVITLGDECENGVPVVDFSVIEPDDSDAEVDNVVEF